MAKGFTEIRKRPNTRLTYLSSLFFNKNYGSVVLFVNGYKYYFPNKSNRNSFFSRKYVGVLAEADFELHVFYKADPDLVQSILNSFLGKRWNLFNFNCQTVSRRLKRILYENCT